MQREHPLPIKFYRTRAGREPVREWLHRLGRDEKKAIGEDLQTVQFGWPVGMPDQEDAKDTSPRSGVGSAAPTGASGRPMNKRVGSDLNEFLGL